MQDFLLGNRSSLTEFILLGFSGNTKINVILFSVFLFLYLVTLLGNGLIITLIHKDSRLHTPMYFFLSVLSILDMGYVTTTVPQMLVHLVSKKKTISYVGCVAQMYIFLMLGITESWLFAIMAYDRYVAICHPLRYNVIMSPLLCGLMVAFCGFWGTSCALIYTISAMILPYCGPNEINHFFCEVPAVLKLACADTSLNDQVGLHLGLHPSVGPTLPHHHCLHQHICCHLENPLIPRATQGLLHLCLPHHCGHHVLYSMYGYVHETWIRGLPRRGQEAGSVLQRHLCLSQPHHLQPEEQRCEEGFPQSDRLGQRTRM
ncbi:hypothetical protein K5549_009201, partial [Capra hircus]